MHKIVGFLSGTRLFAGIEKDELFSILKCLTHKMVKYLKGETIIAEGDKISSIGMMWALHILRLTISGATGALSLKFPRESCSARFTRTARTSQ